MQQASAREERTPKVLVIDDDVRLCAMLKEYLEPEGFQVDLANDGETGLRLARRGEHDIIVLDQMLPKLNGFELLKALRSASDTPVLMLTARDDDIDRIVGLEIGADDYVTKPCNPRELTARLRAILRRFHAGHIAPLPLAAEALTIDDLSIDPQSRVAWLNQTPLELTDAEFNILHMLTAHAGEAVAKARIMQQALGCAPGSHGRSVDTHISRLRKKLGPRADGAARIKTIHKLGYLYPR